MYLSIPYRVASKSQFRKKWGLSGFGHLADELHQLYFESLIRDSAVTLFKKI